MKRTGWLFLLGVGAIVAIASVMPLAWAEAPASQAPAIQMSSSPADTPEVAAMRKLLMQKFPGAPISHIAKSGYLGLYEVMLGDKLIYTDP
ncbi:MAG: hypothetical protein KGL70_07115, partial [Betaproteobacteria bacterium]|nr:hypothetical protein [Betaproteobacteria bacterium]